jgi:hypothetical protein
MSAMSDAQAGVRTREGRKTGSGDNAVITTSLNGHHSTGTDHTPIRCILEMAEDSSIWVIVHPGCSVPDVHDMLRQLALCGGHFEHLTIVTEDGDVAGGNVHEHPRRSARQLTLPTQ